MLFVNVYITEHTCEKPGCGNIILVLDGNMKNHRYVCAATHAGYAEFNGKLELVARKHQLINLPTAASIHLVLLFAMSL